MLLQKNYKLGKIAIASLLLLLKEVNNEWFMHFQDVRQYFEDNAVPRQIKIYKRINNLFVRLLKL